MIPKYWLYDKIKDKSNWRAQNIDKPGDIEVALFEGQVAEKNTTNWKYIWRLVAWNTSDQACFVQTDLTLVTCFPTGGKGGFDIETKKDVWEIGPDEEKVFTGFDFIPTEVAERSEGMRIRLWRHACPYRGEGKNEGG